MSAWSAARAFSRPPSISSLLPRSSRPSPPPPPPPPRRPRRSPPLPGELAKPLDDERRQCAPERPVAIVRTVRLREQMIPAQIPPLLREIPPVHQKHGPVPPAADRVIAAREVAKLRSGGSAPAAPVLRRSDGRFLRRHAAILSRIAQEESVRHGQNARGRRGNHCGGSPSGSAREDDRFTEFRTRVLPIIQPIQKIRISRAQGGAALERSVHRGRTVCLRLFLRTPVPFRGRARHPMRPILIVRFPRTAGGRRSG